MHLCVIHRIHNPLRRAHAHLQHTALRTAAHLVANLAYNLPVSGAGRLDLTCLRFCDLWRRQRQLAYTRSAYTIASTRLTCSPVNKGAVHTELGHSFPCLLIFSALALLLLAAACPCRPCKAHAPHSLALSIYAALEQPLPMDNTCCKQPTPVSQYTRLAAPMTRSAITHAIRMPASSSNLHAMTLQLVRCKAYSSSQQLVH